MHRILANRASPQVLPKAPSPGSNFEQTLAYWSALLHLLVYSFGWSRPDLGLRWWYDAGQPTDDHRWDLINQVWGNDGQLDGFTVWLWTSGGYLPEGHPFAELDGVRLNDAELITDESWAAEALGALDRLGIEHPLSGGNDGFHLSAHLHGPVAEARRPLLLRSARSERRATLMVDSALGWYRSLHELGAGLPDLGDRSWHVDVVAKPLGYLGTYRRSRTTGLWFSGPHSLHSVGA